MLRTRRLAVAATVTTLVALVGVACGEDEVEHQRPAVQPTPSAAPQPTTQPRLIRPRHADPALPGMPRVLDTHNIYSADQAGALSPVVRHDPALVYVPNTLSNTVDVIDQHTFKVIRHFHVGAEPQHVTPSWNLRRLYVLNDNGNSVTFINPRTGRKGRTVQVYDPYNMYFTPNGRFAIVVAERAQRLDFLRPRSLHMAHSLRVDCGGIDHADFTADGRYALFSCEFASRLVVIDIAHQRVVRYLRLPAGSMPQDVKTSPDGKVFYVADKAANGVWIVRAKTMKRIGFRHTGSGAHGLYVSRDAKYLYVTNRGAGSISLINLRTRRVAKTWHIPGGGSPDMGGVSANGKVLWLSGRYNNVVYALSTRNGHLLARIPVGAGPHGLCVYPQPGRYSLGHTGVFR
jgi:YVTN family beta-propeller protein